MYVFAPVSMVSIVDIDRLRHDDANGEDEATGMEEPTTEDDDRETVDTKMRREKARTGAFGDEATGNSEKRHH